MQFGEAGETQGHENTGQNIELTSNQNKTSEKATLVDKAHRVDLKTAVRMRKAVLILSWLSVLVLGSLGIATLVFAILDGSSASFAFALDAILDCLSSLVVIWRYSGNSVTLYSGKREHMACFCLGLLFLLSAGFIFSRSVISLVDTQSAVEDDLLWSFSIANGIVCTVFVVCKLYLAYQLESRSLATDAFNSLIGAILAFAIVIGDAISKVNPDVWLFDPITGMVCALLIFIYGIWIIIESVKGLRQCRTTMS